MGLTGFHKTNLLGTDSEIEDRETPAKYLDAVQQLHDADVLLVGVRVRVPLSMPVVSRETPPLAIRVAQVDTCSHDWPVNLNQVSYVGAVLRHLLTAKNN